MLVIKTHHLLGSVSILLLYYLHCSTLCVWIHDLPTSWWLYYLLDYGERLESWPCSIPPCLSCYKRGQALGKLI